jgi:hypothetical protein
MSWGACIEDESGGSSLKARRSNSDAGAGSVQMHANISRSNGVDPNADAISLSTRYYLPFKATATQ